VSLRNAPIRRHVKTRWLGAIGGPTLLVSLALSGGLAGCSASHDSAADGSAMPAMSMPADNDAPDAAPPAASVEATVPVGSMPMPTQDEIASAWGARPAYVAELPAAAQAAYAFALARPDVLQWLPCYCGCVAMDHRSNLDCFFQRREVAGSFAFEEHASYCGVCVDIANMASRMLHDGSNIRQIRATVDGTFGDLAPGTETPLPPS
jgi:hypothetical protein